MKFVLADTYTFSWPVKVRMPNPDKPGETVEQSFTGRFKLIPIERLTVMENAGRQASDELSELIREGLVGWSDVIAPDGAEIPFSDDALARAQRFTPFQTGVYRAMIDAARGGAAEKN